MEEGGSGWFSSGRQDDERSGGGPSVIRMGEKGETEEFHFHRLVLPAFPRRYVNGVFRMDCASRLSRV